LLSEEECVREKKRGRKEFLPLQVPLEERKSAATSGRSSTEEGLVVLGCSGQPFFVALQFHTFVQI
jgi:CTP synthase (UTP-ammonia lyase)